MSRYLYLQNYSGLTNSPPSLMSVFSLLGDNSDGVSITDPSESDNSSGTILPPFLTYPAGTSPQFQRSDLLDDSARIVSLVPLMGFKVVLTFNSVVLFNEVELFPLLLKSTA
jgi:hypothetical protein